MIWREEENLLGRMTMKTERLIAYHQSAETLRKLTEQL